MQQHGLGAITDNPGRLYLPCQVIVAGQRCLALLYIDERNLVSSVRNMLQAREKLETVILGLLTQVATDVRFEAATKLVKCQRRRKGDGQYAGQEEEAENAAADAPLQGDRKAREMHQ